ncbi:hypothetical protein [Streptomyces massasporeus]|uniref:hypothetical protein n=1 Tax=Streptomyces massasporeus TaxID=67324 RepID=UPI00331B8E5C
MLAEQQERTAEADHRGGQDGNRDGGAAQPGSRGDGAGGPAGLAGDGRELLRQGLGVGRRSRQLEGLVAAGAAAGPVAAGFTAGLLPAGVAAGLLLELPHQFRERVGAAGPQDADGFEGRAVVRRPGLGRCRHAALLRPGPGAPVLRGSSCR